MWRYFGHAPDNGLLLRRRNRRFWPAWFADGGGSADHRSRRIGSSFFALVFLLGNSPISAFRSYTEGGSRPAKHHRRVERRSRVPHGRGIVYEGLHADTASSGAV